jgi:hypothetical protein
LRFPKLTGYRRHGAFCVRIWCHITLSES